MSAMSEQWQQQQEEQDDMQECMWWHQVGMHQVSQEDESRDVVCAWIAEANDKQFKEANHGN